MQTITKTFTLEVPVLEVSRESVIDRASHRLEFNPASTWGRYCCDALSEALEAQEDYVIFELSLFGNGRFDVFAMECDSLDRASRLVATDLHFIVEGHSRIEQIAHYLDPDINAGLPLTGQYCEILHITD